jgi:hypothetical protein
MPGESRQTTAVYLVADEAERLAFKPDDGTPVVQLDNDGFYIYDKATDSWIWIRAASAETADSASALGNIDGGEPDTEYGGYGSTIDGGTP